MKILLVSTCFLLIQFAYAQLTGSAFLSGQSNHSGIKVRFIANSATAVTDSAFTDASGNYSVNLSGGIYDVTFSKQGWQKYYYNNGALLALSNNNTLNTVTLSPGNMVTVSGTVSGSWTANNIYLVTADAIVPSGAQLTIAPGTEVRFYSTSGLTVNGNLTAAGTSSKKIVFTVNSQVGLSGYWKGIVITSSGSVVKHSIVEFAVTCLEGPAVFEENTVRYFNHGIRAANCSAVIRRNEIHNFSGDITSSGIVTWGGKSTVACNNIYDCGKGIVSQDASIITGNTVSRILGTGIASQYAGDAVVHGNFVNNCNVGGIEFSTVSAPPFGRVTSNLVTSCKTAIRLFGVGSASVVANVVVNNQHGIMGCYACPGPTITNNLVWNNSVADFEDMGVVGLGQLVNKNVNADSIDSYFNLREDPLFVHGTPPNVLPQSPCIGAGPNGSNIGPDFGDCSGVISGIADLIISDRCRVYPNPMHDKFTITGVVASEPVTLKLFDLAGKERAIQTIRNGDEFIVTVIDLAEGIYLLRVVSQNTVHHVKLIKR